MKELCLTSTTPEAGVLSYLLAAGFIPSIYRPVNTLWADTRSAGIVTLRTLHGLSHLKDGDYPTWHSLLVYIIWSFWQLCRKLLWQVESNGAFYWWATEIFKMKDSCSFANSLNKSIWGRVILIFVKGAGKIQQSLRFTLFLFFLFVCCTREPHKKSLPTFSTLFHHQNIFTLLVGHCQNLKS